MAAKFSGTRSHLSPDIVALKDLAVSGDSVLDLGCGNGRLSELFVGKKYNYLGADISEELIKIAKLKYSAAKFVQLSDPLKLPFDDNSFEIVYCLAVIHHIPGKEYRNAFLTEISRVLKPGGKLILTSWNMWKRPGNLGNVIKHKLKYSGFDLRDIFYPFMDGDKIIQRYIHCFTKSELELTVKRAGLNIMESKIVERGNEENIMVVAKK